MGDRRFVTPVRARTLAAALAFCLAVVGLAAPTTARRGPKFPPFSTIRDLTDVNGTLFFVEENFSNAQSSLWRTDGTKAGTHRVTTIADFGFPLALTDVAGTLFFILLSEDVELWKSDGTTAGTTVVAELEFGGPFPPFEDEVLDEPPFLQAVSSTLFFVGADADHGIELWKSDGTKAGTGLVKDIFPGLESSSPSGLTAVGDTLFFAAKDGVNGFELWKSDGTGSGTQLVKNIRSLGASAFPRQLTAVGTDAIFFAHDTEHGLGLWRSDGSAAGTTLLKAISGEAEIASELVVAGTTLYFATLNFTPFSPGFGLDLWRSDGTVAGTSTFASLNEPGPVFAGIELEPVGTEVFFPGTAPASGEELWKTDGTSSGTGLVRDIRRGPKSSRPVLLHGFEGSLFFAADDGKRGYEPWVSDGSPAGTRLLKNVGPGGTSSFPNEFSSSGGKVFFTTVTRAGTALWVSDGTRDGTVQLLKDDAGTFVRRG